MSNLTKHQFIIGAPSSNSGKTTITLGLLRAFQKRGLKVQPFKCGPDYIDPKFHEMACKAPSINLDMVMMPSKHLESCYYQYAQKADIALTEGVMGLFDGAVKSQGSTAELSKKLELPVILIVDAKATAYSVAPLLYGFKNFDPDLNFAGVIFNRVNTASHYRFLEEACLDAGVKSFGHVPFLEGCDIPSRHLGLSLDAIHSLSPMVDKIADEIEKTVQLEDLLETVNTPLKSYDEPVVAAKENFKIAVASDEAFNFKYHQNIKKFEQHGKVIYFSPLSDKEVPEADLLYFPGGYPELNAKKLSSNASMRKSIRQFIKDGGKILAECGGLMYMGKTLTDKTGNTFDMVGALALSTSMQKMKLNLGYRKVKLGEKELTGHEFHYSTATESETIPHVGQVSNIRGSQVPTKLYKQNNILASYIHLYFGDEGQFKSIMNLLNISI